MQRHQDLDDPYQLERIPMLLEVKQKWSIVPNITNRELKIPNAKAARASLRAMERFIMVTVENNDPFDDKVHDNQ